MPPGPKNAEKDKKTPLLSVGMQDSAFGIRFGERDEQVGASFEFTGEEEQAVAEALQRLEGFATSSEETAEEIRSACTADALMDYAGSNTEAFESTGDKHSLQRAVAAVAKAYAIYPVPIFIYHMAALAEALGNRASAIRLLRKFLEEQTVFRSSAVAQAILKVRDVPGAVSHAAFQSIAYYFSEGDYDGMARAHRDSGLRVPLRAPSGGAVPDSHGLPGSENAGSVFSRPFQDKKTGGRCQDTKSIHSNFENLSLPNPPDNHPHSSSPFHPPLSRK